MGTNLKIFGSGNFLKCPTSSPDFFLQPLEFLEQFVFVRRKVGFRPLGGWRKQPPEFAAAAERLRAASASSSRTSPPWAVSCRKFSSVTTVLASASSRQRSASSVLAWILYFDCPCCSPISSITRLRTAAWARAMRALRLSKSHWRLIFRASNAAFSASTPPASFSARLTAASSDSLAAAADWARKSPFNFSSRAAKSRTAFFNASSSASISLTPGLFTIFVPQKLNETRPVRECVCGCKSTSLLDTRVIYCGDNLE